MKLNRRKFTALLALIPSVAAASKVVTGPELPYATPQLPDPRTVQEMSRLMLEAAEKAANPPIIVTQGFQEKYRQECLAGFSKVRRLRL